MYWDKWHRRSVSRRRLIAGGGAAAIGLGAAGLVGCGGGGETGGATPGAGTAAAGQSAQPKRGGTIKIVQNQVDFTHLDPHLEAGSQLPRIGSYAYQQLVRKQVGPKNSIYDFPVEGDLAQSWEQPDEKTYIFKLNPKAKWHNIAPLNGRAVTAEDVVYSANRQIAVKIAAAFQAGVNRYTATDANTVKVELNKPDADWLVAMCDEHNKVLSKEVIESKGDAKQMVVGSAAWIHKEWKPGANLIYTRNPEYYRMGADGKPLPYADQFEQPRILDRSTVLAAFRTKQVYTYGGTSRELEDVKRTTPDIELSESTRTGSCAWNVTLRADIPPTNDIRVRKAINKIIDRKAIIDATQDGRAWLGGSMIAASSREDFLSEDELKKLLAPDPAGAKQLLEQAGFKGWKQNVTTYGLPGGYYDGAELVLAQVRAIGIEGALEALDITAFGKYLADHDKAFFAGPRGPCVAAAPNTDLQVSYKTGAVRNVANMSDPELDRLIDAQAAELKDRQRRRDIFHQIQRRLIELAAITPLLTPISLTARLSFLKDYYGTEAAAFEVMWLDQ